MITIKFESETFELSGRPQNTHNWIVTMVLNEPPPDKLRQLDQTEGTIAIEIDGHCVFPARRAELILVKDSDHWLAEVQLREAVRC